MALIVMTGIPCSGKTKRTQDLIKFFQSNYPERLVSVVSDDSLKLLRNQAYKSSHQEKMVKNTKRIQMILFLILIESIIVDCIDFQILFLLLFYYFKNIDTWINFGRNRENAYKAKRFDC